MGALLVIFIANSVFKIGNSIFASLGHLIDNHKFTSLRRYPKS
jgi:hypothetical protein